MKQERIQAEYRVNLIKENGKQKIVPDVNGKYLYIVATREIKIFGVINPK